MIGEIFGRLTVIEEDSEIATKRKFFICKCVCGNYKSVLKSSLTSGDTKSCGCLYLETRGLTNKKHGNSSKDKRTSTYSTWVGMKSRCYNPNTKSYPNYGGRGILICDRWRENFLNFIEDMGEKPFGTSLDRLDNNLGYYKENCAWRTFLDQANNTSRNNFIEYNGCRKTIAQWSIDNGLKHSVIESRIRVLGWTVEEALTTPSGKPRTKNPKI